MSAPDADAEKPRDEGVPRRMRGHGAPRGDEGDSVKCATCGRIGTLAQDSHSSGWDWVHWDGDSEPLAKGARREHRICFACVDADEKPRDADEKWMDPNPNAMGRYHSVRHRYTRYCDDATELGACSLERTSRDVEAVAPSGEEDVLRCKEPPREECVRGRCVGYLRGVREAEEKRAIIDAEKREAARTVSDAKRERIIALLGDRIGSNADRQRYADAMFAIIAEPEPGEGDAERSSVMICAADAIEALVAERDAARAKVARVEALLTEHGPQRHPDPHGQACDWHCVSTVRDAVSAALRDDAPAVAASDEAAT